VEEVCCVASQVGVLVDELLVGLEVHHVHLQAEANISRESMHAMG
jgi:hypothetical protein